MVSFPRYHLYRNFGWCQELGEAAEQPEGNGRSWFPGSARNLSSAAPRSRQRVDDDAAQDEDKDRTPSLDRRSDAINREHRDEAAGELFDPGV